MTQRTAGLALSAPDRQPLLVPRGRLIDAKRIVDRFFTDGDGAPIVTQRWVRDNMPYKIQLSHSRVVWYDGDVQRIIDESARRGVPIKSVTLDDLEAVA